MIYELTGHYRQDCGSLESGILLVEKIGGRFYHAEGLASEIVATEFQVTDSIIGTEITGTVFEFLPDNGECERIGMTIAKLQ